MNDATVRNPMHTCITVASEMHNFSFLSGIHKTQVVLSSTHSLCTATDTL